MAAFRVTAGLLAVVACFAAGLLLVKGATGPAAAEGRQAAGPSDAAVAAGRVNAALASRDRARTIVQQLSRKLDHCTGPDGRPQGPQRFWSCSGIELRQQALRGMVEARLIMAGGLPSGACGSVASGMIGMHRTLAFQAERIEAVAGRRGAKSAKLLPRVDALRAGLRSARRTLEARSWRACEPRFSLVH